MPFSTILRSERFTFADLREVFAKANEEKSGDALASLAAHSERERVAAKTVLADVRLSEIVDTPLLDPDRDEVSRLLLDRLDQSAFRSIRVTSSAATLQVFAGLSLCCFLKKQSFSCSSSRNMRRRKRKKKLSLARPLFIS